MGLGQNEIYVPKKIIERWVLEKKFSFLRKYLIWVLECSERGNTGLRIEELSKIIGYKTTALKEIMEIWKEDKIVNYFKHNESYYYHLIPINKGEEVMVFNHDELQQLLNGAKGKDLLVWFWLQLNYQDLIEQREFMRTFEYIHQNALYNTIRNLKECTNLSYLKVRYKDSIYYELDYSITKVIKTEKSLIELIHIDKTSQSIDIPSKMIEWLSSINDTLAIKVYCEWLVHLKEVPNYHLNTNELIVNIVQASEHSTVQNCLELMQKFNMVSSKTVQKRTCFKLEIPNDSYVSLSLVEFKDAITELKHKEFALWLSLQIEPTNQIKIRDLMDRVKMLSDIQCRNILKRLAITKWLKYKKEKNRLYTLDYKLIQIN